MAFPYKHALMVGATTGIGKAVADRLIESGIKVTAVGRRQARIDEFIQKHGSNMAKGIAYDVVAWQNAPKFAEE
jgi:NADP-dependent 3-hydroxy acid dehydrogenase YdfG